MARGSTLARAVLLAAWLMPAPAFADEPPTPARPLSPGQKLAKGAVYTVFGPIEMVLAPIEGMVYDVPIVTGAWPRTRRGLLCGGAMVLSGIDHVLIFWSSSREPSDFPNQLRDCQSMW